ncbi:MAG: hypothetical protein M1816_003079 [Peltula sp. TS41687]|nr:MAG: hypothetical protein M1816_003079 [Peltula sp. TS41687]
MPFSMKYQRIPSSESMTGTTQSPTRPEELQDSDVEMMDSEGTHQVQDSPMEETAAAAVTAATAPTVAAAAAAAAAAQQLSERLRRIRIQGQDERGAYKYEPLSQTELGSTGEYRPRKASRPRLRDFPATTGQIRLPRSPTHPDYYWASEPSSDEEETSDDEAGSMEMGGESSFEVGQQEEKGEQDGPKRARAQDVKGHVGENSTCDSLRQLPERSQDSL